MAKEPKKLTCELQTLAVVLVDMQSCFVADLHPIDKGNLLGSQSEVLEECAKKDIPLFVLEYERRGPTISDLQWTISKIPRVKVIEKSDDDGFRGTTLDKSLKEIGAKSLIVTGINASHCVFETSVTALCCGYRIITAENLIADAVRHAWRNKTRHWYKQNGTFFDRSIVFP